MKVALGRFASQIADPAGGGFGFLRHGGLGFGDGFGFALGLEGQRVAQGEFGDFAVD